MDMDIYRAMVDLMYEVGANVTYTHRSDGEYDPATGTMTETETVFTVRGIMMDMPLNRNGMQIKDGTLIQDGDKVLYLVPPADMLGPNPTLENTATDFVLAGGVRWRVYNVKTLNPDGTGVIVYEFYLRR